MVIWSYFKNEIKKAYFVKVIIFLSGYFRSNVKYQVRMQNSFESQFFEVGPNYNVRTKLLSFTVTPSRCGPNTGTHLQGLTRLFSFSAGTTDITRI